MADYFWAEIICFYPPGIKWGWDDWDNRANDFPADRWIDTQNHRYGDMAGGKLWVPRLDLKAIQTRYPYVGETLVPRHEATTASSKSSCFF